MLCDKIRHTNAIVQYSTAISKAPRLALGPLRLLDEHGIEGADGISLSFRISQTELGNYVNISQENVISFDGYFKREVTNASLTLSIE